MGDVVSLAVGGTAICGFIAIWIRMGIHKGASDAKIKETEGRVTKLETQVETMREEKHAFEKEIVEIMAEVRTKIGFIFQGIAELKDKQEKNDAQTK